MIWPRGEICNYTKHFCWVDFFMSCRKWTFSSTISSIKTSNFHKNLLEKQTKTVKNWQIRWKHSSVMIFFRIAPNNHTIHKKNLQLPAQMAQWIQCFHFHWEELIYFLLVEQILQGMWKGTDQDRLHPCSKEHIPLPCQQESVQNSFKSIPINI